MEVDVALQGHPPDAVVSGGDAAFDQTLGIEHLVGPFGQSVAENHLDNFFFERGFDLKGIELKIALADHAKDHLVAKAGGIFICRLCRTAAQQQAVYDPDAKTQYSLQPLVPLSHGRA